MAKIQIKVFRDGPQLVTTAVNSPKLIMLLDGGSQRPAVLTPAEQVALVMCQAARKAKVDEKGLDVTPAAGREIIINLHDVTESPGLDCEILDEQVNAVLAKQDPETVLDGTGRVVIEMSRAAFQYLESQGQAANDVPPARPIN